MNPASETPPVAPVSAKAAGAAVLLALVAVAWGGATARPAEAAVLGGLGLLWLLAPARRLPDRSFLICASGLILLAALAWLPATWFSTEPWRHTLQAAGIELPSTLSPQPWLSADALVWLLAGLGWMAWLLGQAWDSRARGIAVRLLVAGTALIAAVALLAWTLHFSVPGWFPDHGFGPFPNRNHTGHVFALAGVLAFGGAADALRRSWLQTLPWVAAAALLLVALVVNYSRGGLLLFFGGILLWFALQAWRRRSWKVLAVGASLVLVLISLVLIYGGPVAARFAGGGDSEVFFRVLIWRDTLSLLHALPWCGGGLGNFRALFPLYRSASVNQQIVLHPESDWLWLAAELGWLGVVAAFGALVAVLRGAFPLGEGSHRRLRVAALAAALAALLHSTFDVPEHRLGSALLALLVLALARTDVTAASPSRLAGVLSRVGGLAALALAVIFWRMPDDAARAETLSQAGRYDEAETAANRALQRAPLDWRAYFTRAGERACRGRTLEAVADFRRARALEPFYLGLPVAEGDFWARRQPALALNAWREALRRVRPPQDAETFGTILAAAPDTAAFREQLLGLVRDRPPLQLEWFGYVPPAEARAHLEEITAAAARCTPAQREAFQRRVGEITAAPASR